jgi:Raf kinase inhibitor-like YbhB/YbcL family protein
MAFALTSGAFAAGNPIPARHTCDGEGLTPPLAWSGAPAGAGSLALVLEDPDAPGGMFRHWGLYNIDPASDGLQESQSAGDPVLHDLGRPGYFPPCPPPGSGVHRYRFRLFALSGRRDFETPPTCQGLLAMIQGDILEEAILVGTCERPS